MSVNKQEYDAGGFNMEPFSKKWHIDMNAIGETRTPEQIQALFDLLEYINNTQPKDEDDD